jgi:hypothetical protein
MNDSLRVLVLSGLGLVLACSSGQDAGKSSPGSGGAAGAGGSAGGANPDAGSYGAAPPINPGGEPIVPFEAVSPYAYLRKVKGLLTGVAPTEEEVKTLVQAQAADRPAVLEQLIDGWINAKHAEQFRSKMLLLFKNVFQQTGFNPTEDFKPQLLENGGFDFGPVGIYGDDAFPRLVQNLEESFARTAWEFVATDQPFTQVLTTQRFMMTTALKSLYLQIEMPNDEPFNFGGRRAQRPSCTTSADCVTGVCLDNPNRPGTLACLPPPWKVDMSGTPIALEQTLDQSNPAAYLLFSDEPPVNPVTFRLEPTCHGEAGRVNQYTGYAQLFQRLLGFTPRSPFAAQPECWEHVSKPLFTTDDLTDWQMVTIKSRPASEAYVEPFDLLTLRKATELALTLPRVGFFTTPAYLALWSTNDSNQHRVTANQTLLVALGKSFTSSSTITPTTSFGLDQEHVVDAECLGCHKSLDPMRQFWANQFDFRDRNDFPTASFNGATPNPRPTATGGGFAFGNVNSQGTTMADFGAMLAQVTDSTSADPTPLSRFAIAMTQQLCYWADSAGCAESDPEFRRVAAAFASGNFNFKTLVKELLSSPLITAAAHTKTFDQRNVMISVSRRQHLCEALSNRLGSADVCALKVAFPYQSGFGQGGQASPYTAQRATFRIAGSVADDAFSRGSELPVTPSDPTLFYRAASELLCEDVAGRVVDVANAPFSSGTLDASLVKMVEVVMGYAPSDPRHNDALQILKDNYQESLSSGGTATNALRSTFSLACQAPTSLAFGL